MAGLIKQQVYEKAKDYIRDINKLWDSFEALGIQDEIIGTEMKDDV